MGLDDILPGMDTEIVIRNRRFTRRQLNEAYNSKDDKWIKEFLELAYGFVEASKLGASCVIFDEHMPQIEFAAILYNDCLPEDHPLRGEFPEENVREYLKTTRELYFGWNKPIPYLNQ